MWLERKSMSIFKENLKEFYQNMIGLGIRDKTATKRAIKRRFLRKKYFLQYEHMLVHSVVVTTTHWANSAGHVVLNIGKSAIKVKYNKHISE